MKVQVSLEGNGERFNVISARHGLRIYRYHPSLCRPESAGATPGASDFVDDLDILSVVNETFW